MPRKCKGTVKSLSFANFLHLCALAVKVFLGSMRLLKTPVNTRFPDFLCAWSPGKCRRNQKSGVAEGRRARVAIGGEPPGRCSSGRQKLLPAVLALALADAWAFSSDAAEAAGMALICTGSSTDSLDRGGAGSNFCATHCAIFHATPAVCRHRSFSAPVAARRRRGRRWSRRRCRPGCRAATGPARAGCRAGRTPGPAKPSNR